MEFIVVKRMEARVGNGKHRQSPLTTSSTDVPQLKSLGYVRNPEISARALEILITRYQSITHYCAHNKMTAHHQRKDEVVLVYVRFLRWHSHSEEVGTMIRGLWFEC